VSDTLEESSGGTTTFRLLQRPGCGFELLGAGTIKVVPVRAAWEVHGGRATDRCRLEPTAGSGGYRLVNADANWMGIASSLYGGEIGADPRSLLLADGALYRLIRSACGFDLLSWEVAVSYAAWRRREGQWCFDANAAGNDLPGIEEIAILSAAMIVAEESEESNELDEN
jgi:hypothetical protein